MKSNVTIASNIYNRSNEFVKKDPEFTKNVMGYTALRELEKYTGTLFSFKLNDVQKSELAAGESRCPYAKNREVTYGRIKIDGEIKWVCRCEYEECGVFESCRNRKRFSQVERAKVEEKNDLKEGASIVDLNYFEYLGLDFNNNNGEELFQEPLATPKALVEWLNNEAGEINHEPEPQLDISGYIEIEDPSIIIESDINSNILVNAGPGTGKTYTVIQRLLYIIKNGLVDAEGVLVLCYTRAAKAVIMERIEKGIAHGELPIEANRLIVCTFDSFATSYLVEIETEFQHLDYNQRIKLFIDKIDPEMFSHFEYLIIDEIQDLVNERATMVLEIIKSVMCGMLLLGDRCQAIYDYDCGDDRSIDSIEFYKLLHEILPDNVLKYELIKNNRQSPKLAEFTDEIRQILLYKEIDRQNELVRSAMEWIPISNKAAEKFLPVKSSFEKTAILCRNNGEAEYISSYLRDHGIVHNLIRGASQSGKLNRWIADALWDYSETKIGKHDFTERYCHRVNDNNEEAEARYECLRSVCNISEQELNMGELRKALASSIDIPAELTCEIEDQLTVSTIHRAKGREFDKVFLVDSQFLPKSKNAEEARVRYVGITRPKEEIEIVKKKNSYEWFFLKNDYGRFIKTGLHHSRNGPKKFHFANQRYCRNIVVGLDSDIQALSFVSEELGDALAIQEYIASKIKINDRVVIRRDKETKQYQIYHNEFLVGALSDDISDDFWNAINKTGDKRNIPELLEDVYVSNIVTVINKQFDEKIPIQFRLSNIWLGIEISGFAKVKYPN